MWQSSLVPFNPDLVLSSQEVFTRATAFSYTWGITCPGLVPVEAGVNDLQLDSMMVDAKEAASSQVISQSAANQATKVVSCEAPIMQLTKEDVRQQIVLLQDGLLGRGEHRMVCLWFR